MKSWAPTARASKRTTPSRISRASVRSGEVEVEDMEAEDWGRVLWGCGQRRASGGALFWSILAWGAFHHA